MATVPVPVLDTRDGDKVTAEAITSLPSELSDRSDSNPAVVMIEANGAMFDKLLYQLNNWPSGVIQKCLSLVGITLLPEAPGLVAQTFYLSAPQPTDTTIPAGTQVATDDGSITYETIEDVTIDAYFTAGSSSHIEFIAASPNFSVTTDILVAGYVGQQIRAVNGTWYTIATVITASTGTISLNASASISGVAYQIGPISATVNAQATTTGLDSAVAAGDLSSLQSTPPGVSSTTNAAASSEAADEETIPNVLIRAPLEFAARDVACSADDYASFAQQALGQGGRSKAMANMNGTTATNGYVTVALLSPGWSDSSAVSATEIASTMRDLEARSFVGATLVDVPANIDVNAIPCVAYYRNSAFDELSAQNAIAAAFNTYFSPNTYEWGRSSYVADLIRVVEELDEVDRVHMISGIPAVGYCLTGGSHSMTFTNGSVTVTSATNTDVTLISSHVGRTFLVDRTNRAVYLVTAAPSSTSLTLSAAFAGSTMTQTSSAWFYSEDVALSNWYTLPFSDLNADDSAAFVDTTSIISVGSV